MRRRASVPTKGDAVSESTFVGKPEGASVNRAGWVLGGLIAGYAFIVFVGAVQLFVAWALPGYESLGTTADVIVDLLASTIAAAIVGTVLVWSVSLRLGQKAVPRITLWSVGVVPLLAALLYVPDAVHGFYAPVRSPLAVVAAVGFALLLSGQRLRNPGFETEHR